MKQGFEDAFMDIQSGFVSLCLEYAENADRIFIYVYQTDKSRMFNAFFDKDGQIVSAGQIGTDEQSDEFLAAGRNDIEKLRDVCLSFEHPCPVEMKLTYYAATGKFDAQYGYEDHFAKEKTTPMTEFLNWFRAEKKKG